MNFKNIIIWLAVAFSFIAVGCIFVNSADYQQKIDALQSQNSVLEENRKRLGIEFAQLKKDLEILKEREAELNSQILLQTTEIEHAKSQAAKSQFSLNKLQQELNKTRKKIKDLEDSPANRSGDDLLNSIKIKTQL